MSGSLPISGVCGTDLSFARAAANCVPIIGPILAYDNLSTSSIKEKINEYGDVITKVNLVIQKRNMTVYLGTKTDELDEEIAKEKAEVPGKRKKLAAVILANLKGKILNAKLSMVGSLLTLAGVISLIALGILTGPLIIFPILLLCAMPVITNVVIHSRASSLEKAFQKKHEELMKKESQNV